MNNKITMQELADRLNISKNAVSLALNNKPGVSDDTRQLVLTLANKLGYSIPSQKHNSDSNNIFLFIPEYIRDDSHFYNDIYWSADYYSGFAGYNLIMTTITQDMQRNNITPSILDEVNYIGIMLIGVFEESYAFHLTTLNCPLLTIDHYYYNLAIPSVVTANMEGAYYITRKVIEYGHKEIGFIGSIDLTSSIYERWCGFQRAISEYGILNNENYNIHDPSPLTSLFNNPDELYQYLTTFDKFPTVFVCAGDRIAVSCMQALQRLNMKIPDEISVVGFDDIELGKYTSPRLTTMHVKRKSMGEIAVKQLLRISRSKAEFNKIALNPTYVERESLKRI